MGKKSEGKDKGKRSQLLIRVEKAEREAFVALCETLDTSAAREIRRFMRDYVARNSPAVVESAPDAPDAVDPVSPPAEEANTAPEPPTVKPVRRRAAKAKAQ